jgi:hypothetical protein
MAEVAQGNAQEMKMNKFKSQARKRTMESGEQAAVGSSASVGKSVGMGSQVNVVSSFPG